jgi:hypothetical protein
VRLLQAYREQLAAEAAGRSHRFRDILRALRLLWFVVIALGLGYAGLLIVSDLRNPYAGGGWSMIIGPVVILAAVVFGAIPYKLGQLFLGVRADNNG